MHYYQIFISDLDSLCQGLIAIDTLKYSTNTLAMEWQTIGDSIIYLKYVGRPVIGQILVYPGIHYETHTDIKGKSWKTPDIIWIGKDYIEIGKIRYTLPEKLKEFIEENSVEIEVADNIYLTD